MQKKKKPYDKVEHLEKYKKYLTSYKSVKMSLKRVIKHQHNLEKIDNAASIINKIIGHTYQFLKLYCMNYYNAYNDIPDITETFITTIFKVIGTKRTSGRPIFIENNELVEKLKKFYDKKYKPYMFGENDMSYTGLSNVLEYEAVGIMTNITNHISEHFEDCFKTYINARLNVKQIENDIQKSSDIPKVLKKLMLKLYRKRIWELKNDILFNTRKCNPLDVDFKYYIRKNYLPEINEIPLSKMLTDEPLKFLPYMIKMSLEIEKSNDKNINIFDFKKPIMTESFKNMEKELMLKNFNNDEIKLLNNSIKTCYEIEKINNKKEHIKNIKKEELESPFKKLEKKLIIDNFNENQIKDLENIIKICSINKNQYNKTFTCFPLRKSNIPKYIKLDTLTIVFLLFGEKENKSAYAHGNLKANEGKLWNKFFRTEMKCFKKKGYKFAHSIVTDGIGCTILFIRKDLYNETRRTIVRTVRKPYSYKETMYVDDLSEKEKEEYRKLKAVGGDPGKCRLLYATDGNTKIITKANGKTKHKTTTFQYTQDQVRHDMKIKKYRENIKKYKKDALKRRLNVFDIEDALSKHDSKSLNYEKIKDYILTKNNVNYQLNDYYKGEIFRKQKWFSFINRQKSEAEMINKFIKTFGSQKEVVLLIGDWSEGKHMKGREPTKGKAIRRLFTKNHFKIFLVNEYNTSKKSFIDGLDMEKFLYREDPRPWKNGSIRLVNGLLRSKNDKFKNDPNRRILMNRDLNGSMNILKKGKCILNNIEVPIHLRR